LHLGSSVQFHVATAIRPVGFVYVYVREDLSQLPPDQPPLVQQLTLLYLHPEVDMGFLEMGWSVQDLL
jgi:hypothetical protein